MNTPAISTRKVLVFLNFLAFVLMVWVNGMAVYLPLNNKSTKQLSDQYPNLFVPAGITFSIWSIIYLLLLCFCLGQMVALVRQKSLRYFTDIATQLGLLFVTNALLNAAWIVAWHYENLILSVVIMLGLLANLFKINATIKKIAPQYTASQLSVFRSAFGLYLGWICVATIANITAVLVGYNVRLTFLPEEFWASAVIIVGASVGYLATQHLRNPFIPFAIIWAFSGIIIARNQAPVLYQSIIYSALVGIAIMVAALVRYLMKK